MVVAGAVTAAERVVLSVPIVTACALDEPSTEAGCRINSDQHISATCNLPRDPQNAIL